MTVIFLENPMVNNEKLMRTFKYDKTKELQSPFMRKGATNTYKDEMTEQTIKKFDQRTENVYRKVGFVKYLK